MKDGVRECRFRNERVTLDGLERGAGRIGGDLVVTRNHPDLIATLDTNLARSQNVTGWMQRQFDTVLLPRLSIRKAINMSPRAHPML